MTSIDGAGWGVGAAILAMAVATYAMRATGFWLMARVPVTPRLRRMLDALPGSVVVAPCFRWSCARGRRPSPPSLPPAS